MIIMFYHKIRLVFLLTILVVSFAAVENVKSQTTSGTGTGSDQHTEKYSYDFSGLSPEEALDLLVDTTGINLVYNKEMLKGKRTSCRG